MTSETQSRILVKIFLGCPLTAELRLKLSKSQRWKEFQIIDDSKELSIVEVRHDDRDYLGCLIEGGTASLQSIEHTFISLKRILSKVCDDYQFDRVKFIIFPQIFIR
ncbi:MAG: hypothetical protein H7A37_07290 [Chlamydiales bacterium]|nr:hypothetical protein [Chlamydiia bacterium]MCP5508087.1 hypothetical protein [Chlamydiales bacterium]